MTQRRIAIVGDGKMGAAIKELAESQGWTVTAVIGERASDSGRGITPSSLSGADVAVEFTQPDAAVANVGACLRAGVPTVVGTTGWYEKLPDVTRLANETGAPLLWSPNFSIGVNVLLELARHAGQMLAGVSDFDAHIVETHHAKKKDAPSGTAVALEKAAEEGLRRPIPVTSVRTGSVPGTHELIFDGTFEQITLTHTARDRRVFAEGALRAAAWLIGKKGVYTMRDVLQLPANLQRGT